MCEETSIPENARCLACEYLLHGLPSHVCPECGRPFDPADPATFDTRPGGWRRRKWIKRGGVALAILLAAYCLFPRRAIKSNMSFTCTKCGQVLTFRRWEPQTPTWNGWAPFRYPGYDSTNEQPPTSPASATACTAHSYDVSVRFDLYIGGRCSGSGRYTPGEDVVFNGMIARPDTAPDVLKALTAPANNGVMVYTQPAPGPPGEPPKEEPD